MAPTKKRAKQNAGDEVNQTFCLIATGGHLWMRGYFDNLAVPVRQRLRQSPYNICPACLVLEVLPTVRRAHPNWPREKQLLAAVAAMESEVRKEANK